MIVKDGIQFIRFYFRNITVRRQFFFAGALSTGLLLSLCIYGIVQLDATNRQTSKLTNVDIPALQTTNTLYIEFLKLSKNSDLITKKSDSPYFNSIIANIDKEFNTLLNYDLTVSEFEKLQTLQKLWIRYQNSENFSNQDIIDLESSIIALQEVITEEARLRSIKVGELFSVSRQRIFLLLIIGVILITSFYYQLTKKFLAPLNKGLGLVRAMQRGDLTTRINISDNNEIGALCQALNRACVALAEKSKLEAKQNEKIYQANKLISLGTLVAGVAHEINNPNSNITFNTPLLSSLLSDLFLSLDKLNINQHEIIVSDIEYNQLQDDILGMVDTIEKSAYRIKYIIEGLREYSRPVIEPHSFVRIDISQLIKTTFELIGKQLEKSINNIDLILPNDKIFIQGNFVRLEQVLVNIINNAKEAMNDITNSQLKVIVVDSIENVSIEVHDNGVGIDNSILDQITDPFFTTKRSINGTGLGLSVVESILSEHNAQMQFDSTVNHGTTVIMTFIKD